MSPQTAEQTYTWPHQPTVTEPGLPVPPWSPSTPVSGTPPPGDRYAAQRRSLARLFPVPRERTPPIVLSRPVSEGDEADDDAGLAEILAPLSPPSMALTEDQRRQGGEGAEAVAAWVSRLALDKPSTSTSTLNGRAPPFRPHDAYRPTPQSYRPLPRPGFRPLAPSQRPPARPFPERPGTECANLRQRMARTHPDDHYYHYMFNNSASHCYVMFPIPSDISPDALRCLMEEDIGRVFSVRITDGVATVVFEDMMAFPARRYCECGVKGRADTSPQPPDRRPGTHTVRRASYSARCPARMGRGEA